MKVNPNLRKSVKRKLEKYYHTDHWKEFRKIVKEMTGGFCQKCGKYADYKLDVHHINYERLGFEDFTDVIAVCKACHKKYHTAKNTDVDDLIDLDYLDPTPSFSTR